MTTAIITQDRAELATVATYAADRNPAAVYLASLGESSRRPQSSALDAIARLINPDADALSFPWHLMRYQHTAAIRSMLADTYSASTANRHLSALRGVLKECWRLGYVDAETYHRSVDLKSVKGQKAAQAEKGRHLDAGEVGALLAAAVDGSAAGYRNAALVAIGYACGLRRAELAALDLADFDPAAGTLTVRAGKGNKERIVPIENGTRAALEDWIHVRGDAPGRLFLRVRRGDNVTADGLTPEGVYNVFMQLADAAQVGTFTPHDLRRTFAGDLLDAGADIVTVQKLMGHANSNTTAGYDRRDARAKRAAVARLHVPYKRHFGG